MPTKRSNTYQGRKIRTGPRGGKYILKGGQKRYLSGGQACAMGGKGRCKKSKTDDGQCDFNPPTKRCRKKKAAKPKKKTEAKIYKYSKDRMQELKTRIEEYAIRLADPDPDNEDPTSRILLNNHQFVIDDSYIDRNMGMSVDDIVRKLTNFMKNFKTKYRYVEFDDSINHDPFGNLYEQKYKLDLGTLRQWTTEERDWEIIKAIMETAADNEDFYIGSMWIYVDTSKYGEVPDNQFDVMSGVY
jgi:hypothetical protein